MFDAHQSNDSAFGALIIGVESKDLVAASRGAAWKV
jgi:hypothetical protein